MAVQLSGGVIGLTPAQARHCHCTQSPAAERGAKERVDAHLGLVAAEVRCLCCASRLVCREGLTRGPGHVLAALW